MPARQETASSHQGVKVTGRGVEVVERVADGHHVVTDGRNILSESSKVALEEEPARLPLREGTCERETVNTERPLKVRR